MRPLKEPMTMPRAFSRRSSCRICKDSRLLPFLSLGELPLANHYLTERELSLPEQRLPHSLYYCRNCSLVQLIDVVDPEILFRNYPYFSSASKPLVDHFSRVASEVLECYVEGQEDLVCEIGSNDGIFLKNFLGKARVVGVDPARHIAAAASAQGIPTLPEFFDEKQAAEILSDFGKARIIFAANVFAHIDNLDGVMEGVRTLLEDDGVFIFEVHRFADMLMAKCFDQIYHEHLCYFTLRPLEHLLGQFGMRIFDVKKIPIHGESFHIHAAKEGNNNFERESVARMREEESLMGLDDVQTHISFAGEVGKLKNHIREMLVGIKSGGKRIVGYGAPSKGNTLLNYCNIDNNIVDYIVDTTPFKQGLFTPGSRIPIYPPQRIYEDTPDYVLLLAWNYADYILNKEHMLRDNGTKFIIPIPSPTIV